MALLAIPVGMAVAGGAAAAGAAIASAWRQEVLDEEPAEGWCIAKHTPCTTNYFPEALFNAEVPMEYHEFAQVFDDLNAAMMAAFPFWKRFLPFIFGACMAFVLVCVGLNFRANAPEEQEFGAFPHEVKVIFSFFFAFVALMFSGVFLQSYNTPDPKKGEVPANVMSALLRKLSELNARYQNRSIELKLVAWQKREQQGWFQVTCRTHSP